MVETPVVYKKLTAQNVHAHPNRGYNAALTVADPMALTLPRSRGLALAAVITGLALVLAPASTDAQSHFEGEIGPGSSYEIDVPTNWNGALVVYAHGIVQADLPVMPPSMQPEYNELRITLLSGGFALTRTGERRWVLVKARDEAARPGTDIVTERPASVRSGRTWQELPGR